MSLTAKDKAQAFLRAMTPEENQMTVAPASKAVPRPSVSGPPSTVSRAGLKHIGGYLDKATVEKVAILRARLGLDNSELIRLAVEDLYAKHAAKRAFGDT